MIGLIALCLGIVTFVGAVAGWGVWAWVMTFVLVAGGIARWVDDFQKAQHRDRQRELTKRQLREQRERDKRRGAK